MRLSIWLCMSQPPYESVTNPQPASHKRRARSICSPKPLPYFSSVVALSFLMLNASGAPPITRLNACCSKRSMPSIAPERSMSLLSRSRLANSMRRSPTRCSGTASDRFLSAWPFGSKGLQAVPKNAGPSMPLRSRLIAT